MPAVYTDDEKRHALDRALDIGNRAAAAELGCSPTMLTYWRRQLDGTAPHTRLHLTLDNDTLDRLQAHATDTGRTVPDVIRQAVELLLDRTP